MRTLNIVMLAIMTVVSFSSVSYAEKKTWKDRIEDAKETAKTGKDTFDVMRGEKDMLDVMQERAEEDPDSVSSFFLSHNIWQYVTGYYWSGMWMLMAMFCLIFLLKSLGKRKSLFAWIFSFLLWYIFLIRPIVFFTEYSMRDEITPVGLFSIGVLVILLGFKHKFVIGVIRALKNRVFIKFWKGDIGVDDVAPQPDPTSTLDDTRFEQCPSEECQKMAFINGKCRICGYKPLENPVTPPPQDNRPLVSQLLR